MYTKSQIKDVIRAVRFVDGFWHRVVERTRTATVPHVLEQLEKVGELENLLIAAGKSDKEHVNGGSADSNVAKTLEGMAYALMLEPDAKLEARLDELIAMLADTQEDDGYLNSYFSTLEPESRYTDLHRSHELYSAGHVIEGAVAHFEATGKRHFLDIAIKLADHIDATFGPGKLETAPGHQEIELALVRLYHVTGEQRYLDLGRYFVDMRGDPDMVHRDYSGKPVDEGDRRPGRNRPPQYRQDHEPMLEQRYATGHAVRAGYLYAGLTDIALEYDSEPHAVTAKAIWDDIITRKLYITGGVGTHQYRDEGYGDPYLLPNETYCETCGCIALLMFSHRLGLLTGEAKYADVVEQVLYNNYLASTNLAGTHVFYRNPLTVDAPRTRHPWNNPPCCPTNIVRMGVQLARYAYATGSSADGASIYVDQFGSSVARLSLDASELVLKQETRYPWDGEISITVELDSPRAFSLHVRIPGWTDGRPVPSDLYHTTVVGESGIVGESGTVVVAVNGSPVEGVRRDGYSVISREWASGDQVTISLPMPVRRVYAHPNVEACKGRVALMRGPLVHCIEEVDNGDPLELTLPADAALSAEIDAELLGGVSVIHGNIGGKRLTAVPYCVWNNREPGKMLIWLPE